MCVLTLVLWGLRTHTWTDYQSRHRAIDQRMKKPRTTEEEMDWPTSPWGLRNRQHA
jgi:hypothetical protein